MFYVYCNLLEHVIYMYVIMTYWNRNVICVSITYDIQVFDLLVKTAKLFVFRFGIFYDGLLYILTLR